jgi:hypothetical protein
MEVLGFSATRAQCIVRRGDKLLKARHHLDSETWWCLPGGVSNRVKHRQVLPCENFEKDVMCGASSSAKPAAGPPWMKRNPSWNIGARSRS